MKLATLLLLLGCVHLSIGQGLFIPEDADLSFPRSIIDSNQIDQVRTDLANEHKLSIYNSIYQYAKTAVPQENSMNQDRRLRSQIAREAAFVILMDRAVSNNSIQALSPAEKELLLAHALEILNNINAEVEFQEGWSFYYTWQFRSKELIHLLIAYDLLKGAGIPDEFLNTAKINLQTFAGNLYTRSIALYPNPIPGFQGIDFFFYNPNNHGIMVSAALGLAGIVLADADSDNPNQQPVEWIKSGLWNLDNLLWQVDGLIPRVSDRNTIAGYAEGPNYFYYGYQNAFPFIRALWNYLPNQQFNVQLNGIERSIAHPWYDQNYHNLYKWMMLIRMPDGRSPAIHDSASGFTTQFTALSGEAAFNIPSSTGSYSDFWTRTQYLCTEVDTGTYEEPLFQALPDAGSLVFRSEYNDPEGIYMHLIGKNGIALEGAKNHHQADATSFQLYYKGHIFAIDEGYTGSGYSSFVNKAKDHNLILVDGKGPTPPVSEWTNSDNEVFIEDYLDLDRMDFGSLNAHWQNADLSRNVLFVDDRYFVIWDDCRSGYPRQYTFQLHASGLAENSPDHQNGTLEIFPDEQKALLTKSDDHVLILTQSSIGEAQYELLVDSTFNGSNTHYHNKIHISAAPAESMQFTSLIVPFSDATPDVQLLNDITDGNAMKINQAESTEFIFSQNENTGRPINFNDQQKLWSNALNTLISLDQTEDIRLIHLREGDSLFWQNTPVVFMDQLRNLSMEYFENNSIKGFVNGPAQISIYSDTSLLAIEGDIETVYYDPNNNLATFQIPAAGYFVLEPGAAIISDVSMPIESSANKYLTIAAYPNPGIDFCTINIRGLTGKPFTYTLFDSHGSSILSKKDTSHNGQFQIHVDLTSLPAGNYPLQIQQNTQLQTIIIQKSN